MKFLKDTLGQDLIEYALIAGIVACGIGTVYPAKILKPPLMIFAKAEHIMCYASAEGREPEKDVCDRNFTERSRFFK